MKKQNPLTREQLKAFDKDLLVEMVYSLTEQVEEMNNKLAFMTEQINVMKNQRFGRHSEKSETLDGQMEFIFNETEIVIDEFRKDSITELPIEELIPLTSEPKGKTPHPKGRREEILKDVPREDIFSELSGDDLRCGCGGTFVEKGEEKVVQLIFIPASFKLEIHHVKTYECPRCGAVRQSDGPIPLFDGSYASPSLISGIMNAKFINAMTYYRLEKEFQSLGVPLKRATMARWMVWAAERYFCLLYDRLKADLLDHPYIHADETTVMVTKDGRKAGAKSFMWVYTKAGSSHPVVIFEYQKTRAHAHAKEFLKDYKGHLVCDGYEAYHSLGGDIVVCGCWAHARRHYDNAAKALKKLPERKHESDVSSKALEKIAEFYRLENSWKELTSEERLCNRQKILKPKVEAYFEWVAKVRKNVPPKSETGKGLTYSVNQKKYLTAFLEDGNVPLDNSEAERKIRNFVISRKNFVMIDTLTGAEASAVLFSMCETARANNLEPYDYFKYLLEKIPKHMGESSKDMSFLNDLLPWSDKLPKEIRRNQ